jgi:ADP-dependent NAD(P)H-hydrate dehydratase / NAD(P)H-hydrate epimerase
VRAVATATFHRAKPGLWINPGKAHAGAVEVIDIGIPPGSPAEPHSGLIGPDVLREIPRRGPDSTKFTSGNVVVLGGSSGLTGAPTMSAMAAMRSGAGYVTVGAPASLEATLSARLLEAMLAGLPEDGASLTEGSVETALGAISRADAVVLGPGLGRTDGARAFARAMITRVGVPLVIDADGLNALAGVFPEDLPQRRWPTILTPHAGELGRLLDVESGAVEAHRLEHARAAAATSRAIVVLKGDDTLVCSPNGRVAISRGGAPALATAGTGDVLSGVTGAMLAKRLPSAHAACAAVFAHLRAGRLAAAPHGPDGVIASDVIEHLPAALSV